MAGSTSRHESIVPQETGKVTEVKDSQFYRDRSARETVFNLAEAFNILEDFHFEYTDEELEDDYEGWKRRAAISGMTPVAPLQPTWTLNTSVMDDLEKDAMVDRIDAILGTEEGVDAVGAAGAAASK